MKETTWVKRLGSHEAEYDRTVASSVRTYSNRVISAYIMSDELGMRNAESWAPFVESDSIGDVTHSLAGAYMLGKTQANHTLPPNMPKFAGFRADDMTNVNRLRDFSSDEISKFANDLRVVMKLRTLERQSKTATVQRIRRDVRARRPRINTMARTEIMRAANEGRLREYAHRGVVEVEWVSHPGCCGDCEGLEGERMFLSRVPPLPVHPNCRCSVSAVR
jgi:SPP1 gp7 family putative phage head morphogenesis protein